VGDAIISRMNTEMAALGLRGVSVVFASGDSGYQVGRTDHQGAASASAAAAI
jgi:subtilase family serine protease